MITPARAANHVGFCVLLAALGCYSEKVAAARAARRHALRTAALPLDEDEMADLVQQWLAQRAPTRCPPRYAAVSVWRED